MSLFSALSVGASGMSAQRARAELLVENLANAETTRTPEGGPYRRKDAVFESAAVESPFSSVFSSELEAPTGVAVSGYRGRQQRARNGAICPAIRTRTPDGYVAFPKMNPAEDMVDLMDSARTYEANVAAIGGGERHDPTFHRPASLSSLPWINHAHIDSPDCRSHPAGFHSSGRGIPRRTGRFRDVFAGAVGQVESMGEDASRSVERFLSGEGEDVHTAVLATQRAELAFEMFQQVRNKVVGAYQEIMKMQM